MSDTSRAAAGPASISSGRLSIKGSPIGGENPLPFYRDPRPDLPVEAGEGFPPGKREGFGRDASFRILPWRRQDRYDRAVRALGVPSILLQDGRLRAEILPSLGGRLWSLRDEAEGREILYRNPVIRPANLAIRDAWLSGGIEWNVGRLGHSTHTCSPVFAGSFADAEGNPVLRLWDFERQARLHWRVELRLPPDSPVLLAYVRVENPDPVAKPLYWWTNVAVPETDGVRVLSPGEEAIYIVPGAGDAKRMGGGTLPELAPLPGQDITFPSRSDYSNEYFMQCERSRRGGRHYPWEAAAQEDGRAFAEASSPPLSFRKMFCWGRGRGGRRWQDYLSLPGERYLEVQAGLAPTQLHTATIGAGACADWVQAFGSVRMEPDSAFSADYRAAVAHAEERVAGIAGPDRIRAWLELARASAGRPCERILSLGLGWGAVETRRAALEGEAGPPPAVSYPAESVGEAEAPWMSLLETGRLPPRTPLEGPPSFMIGADWELRLARAESGRASPGSWLAPYLAGVSLYERGEYAAADSARRRSLAAERNSWALRDLAVAALREGRTAEAIDLYREAVALPEGAGDPAFAEEFVPLLLSEGRAEEAWALLDSLPPHFLDGPLRDAAARAALERGDDETLDRILSEEPPRIREGNETLVEIWAEREARRLAAREGLGRAEAAARVRDAIARRELEPPQAVDFRMAAGRSRR